MRVLMGTGNRPTPLLHLTAVAAEIGISGAQMMEICDRLNTSDAQILRSIRCRQCSGGLPQGGRHSTRDAGHFSRCCGATASR